MKHKRHIFLALAVFAMMTACKTKEDLNPTDLSVTPDLKEIQFNADGSRTDGEAENAYLFFVVTNQIDWNVTSDQTWCKTSKQGSQLRISADVNTSSDVPPAATNTVTTAGEEHKITNVATQAAATAVPEQPEQPPVSPTLTLSPNLDAMEFDVNGVSATSNGSVIVPRFTVATNQL
ncbi:MAG: hypothetical protein LBS09_08240, partial [Bacteroidales bacterium]|nr:hypothetical protein [Bacteroidales bacterium]